MRGIRYILACCLLLLGWVHAEPETNRLPGVRVTYYEGANFETQVLQTYEPHMRFDCWVPMAYRGYPELFGPYSVRWEGELLIDQTGLYRLTPTRMDDIIVRIFLDGEPVSFRKVQRQVPDRRGRLKTREVIESRSQMLKRGPVPVVFELSNPGAIFVDEPIALRLQQLGKDPVELPSSMLQVEPWEGMQRRGMLRFAMVGHSNVTQVHHKGGWDGKGTRSWVWNPDFRSWQVTGTKFGCEKPSDMLVDKLSELYPQYCFGGVETGANGSHIVDEWKTNQVNFATAVREINRTAYVGPMFAMGCHFDWREMSDLRSAKQFEKGLQDLIVNMREAIGQVDMPWLVTRITPLPDWRAKKNREKYDLIHAAADQAAETLEYIGVVTCDDFVVSVDLNWPDAYHYSPTGQAKWVERSIMELKALDAIERAAVFLAQSHDIAGSVVVPAVKGRLVLEGELLRVSNVRNLKQLAPYKDALMVIEYRRLTPAPDYEYDRFVVVTPSIRDKAYLPTATYKKGDRHKVTVTPWEAQPRSITQLPVDDDIEEFELPLLYATEFEGIGE